MFANEMVAHCVEQPISVLTAPQCALLEGDDLFLGTEVDACFGDVRAADRRGPQNLAPAGLRLAIS